MKKWIVLALTTALACSQLALAKSKTDPNSSLLPTPPVYDKTGSLHSSLLGKYHSSGTTADGNTQSWWCDSSATSTDCHEGTGLIQWLKLPNGGMIYWTQGPVDLDRWGELPGQFDPVQGDDALSPLAADGTTVFFRYRVGSDDVHGPDKTYLCIPLLHLPVFTDGKEREKYAKHHSLEACYMISNQVAPPPSK